MSEPQPEERKARGSARAYSVVLVSICVIYLLQPTAEHRILGRSAILFLFLGIFVPAVFGTMQNRAWFAVMAALGVLSLTGGIVALFEQELVLGRVVPTTLFLGGAALSFLWDVLRQRRVTIDTVLGALCVYLVSGFFFAHVFFAIESFVPGSLAGPLVRPDGRESLSNFYYFSFVTLTTLGYGDILPASAPVRALATLEAILGQMYLAVLVARLVGIQITQSVGRPTAE